MQCSANEIEHPSVSTSPRLIDEKSGRNAAADPEVPAAGRAVISTIPTNASAAPRNAFHRGALAPGGLSAGAIENNGTSTTTSPVMNADFEGVVRTSPIVWN